MHTARHTQVMRAAMHMHAAMQMQAAMHAHAARQMHMAMRTHAAEHIQAMQAAGHMHMAQPRCRAQCAKPQAVFGILRLLDVGGSHT